MAWKAYLYLINDCLGVYGIRLRRPDWDKFAGAVHTDVLDTILPSGKVLQSVGAHYLGQKFAKPFDIKFLNQSNQPEFAYMTCYGVSTRLLASTLGIHGDNKGLILPPKVSRYQVMVMPVVFSKPTSLGSPSETAKILRASAEEIFKTLKDAGIRAVLDISPKTPGDKFYYWEMKGVPLRLEIGPKDYASGQCRMVRRDNGSKTQVEQKNIVSTVKSTLDTYFSDLQQRSLDFHNSKVHTASSLEECAKLLKQHGGFVRIPVHSMGNDGKEADEKVHDITGGEIRGYVPTETPPPEGTICATDPTKPAQYWGYVAKAY